MKRERVRASIFRGDPVNRTLRSIHPLEQCTVFQHLILYGKFICAAKQQIIYQKPYNSTVLKDCIVDQPTINRQVDLLELRPLTVLSSGHWYCVSSPIETIQTFTLRPDLLKLNNRIRTEIVLYLLWPNRVPRYCSKSLNICTTS